MTALAPATAARSARAASTTSSSEYFSPSELMPSRPSVAALARRTRSMWERLSGHSGDAMQKEMMGSGRPGMVAVTPSRASDCAAGGLVPSTP